MLTIQLDNNNLQLLLQSQCDIEKKCNVKLIFSYDSVQITPSCMSIVGDSCVEHAFNVIMDIINKY